MLSYEKLLNCGFGKAGNWYYNSRISVNLAGWYIKSIDKRLQFEISSEKPFTFEFIQELDELTKKLLDKIG